MNAPQTYYEWVQILNIIKAGTQDNEALAVLYQGKLEHQAGVYERFINRLTQTINARFSMSLDNFQKTLNNNNDNFEKVISQALDRIAADMGLIPQLAALPALKDKEKQELSKLMQQEMNRIGESLTKSAQADRSGKLLSILRNKGFKV
jgi:hypothetical protein